MLDSTTQPRELRRRALISAAGRAFGSKGFHNTTLDDVAVALGVTKPALYRYVKSKHEILYECHQLAIGMAEDALTTAESDASSPLEALHRFVDLYIRNITGEMGTCVVLTEYYSMTTHHNALIQTRRRLVDTRLRSLVVQSIEQRLIAPCDPKLAVFFFMGAINNINRWFAERGGESGDAIAKAFADHVIDSLRPRVQPRDS